MCMRIAMRIRVVRCFLVIPFESIVPYLDKVHLTYIYKIAYLSVNLKQQMIGSLFPNELKIFKISVKQKVVVLMQEEVSRLLSIIVQILKSTMCIRE